MRGGSLRIVAVAVVLAASGQLLVAVARSAPLVPRSSDGDVTPES